MKPAMRLKQFVGLTVLTVVMIIGAIASPVAAAFINFDDLPSPGPNPLILPGITFTYNQTGGVYAVPAFSGYIAPSQPNVYCASVQALTGTATYTSLTCTFDTPVFLVKFQIRASGYGPETTDLHVEALDQNGLVVDSQGLPFTPGSEVYTFYPVVLCSKGIKSLVFKTTVTNATSSRTVQWQLDNFSYYPLAPSATVVPLF